ncbi:MAG: hypothetical protein EOP83_36840 [Verrucomicrobiaceae bacterium]|nr:MAG: hypothetical protein EOP83_36840 [Verrucomicrobiaceae bacterium]
MTSNPEAQRTDAHSRRFLKTVAGVIALMSAVQLYVMLYMTPKFGVIFADMFSEREVPPLGALVIRYQWALAAFACLLPISGWLIARYAPIPRMAAAGLAIILGVVIAQVPLTTFALLAPVIRLVNSLSPK